MVKISIKEAKERIVEIFMKAGMNEHLSKPVEPDKLFDTMARLIKQRAEEGVNKNEDEEET